MLDVIALLFVLWLVALIVGLIKPSLIIRWGAEEHKTRKQILGLAFFSFMAIVILGVLMKPSSSKKETAPITAKELMEVKNEEVQVTKEEMENGKVTRNEDGSVTIYYENDPKYHNIDVRLSQHSLTKYPDGSSIVLFPNIPAMSKTTAAFAAFERCEKEPTMSASEIQEAAGGVANSRAIADDSIKNDRERLRRAAQKYGFDLEDKKYMINHIRYRAKDKILERSTMMFSKADLSKEDAKAVVEEIRRAFLGIIKENPGFVDIAWNVENSRKDERDGQLQQITLHYYKDKKVEAMTQDVTVFQEKDGKLWRNSVRDIVQ